MSLSASSLTHTDSWGYDCVATRRTQDPRGVQGTLVYHCSLVRHISRGRTCGTISGSLDVPDVDNDESAELPLQVIQ
jgi:hypothetical protein